MMDHLTTERVLILGGSCRLALDLTLRLIDRQIYPLITYRDRASKERIQSLLSPLDPQLKLIHLDFTDPTTLSHLTSHLKPAPDCAVDFAHSDYESLVGSASDENISAYFSTNISFRAMVIKRLARAMLTKRNGRLVFVSSTAAEHPNPGQGFYAAAKLACEAIYRNIGLEMASRGISSTILRPGYVSAGRGKRFLDRSPSHSQQLKKVGQIVPRQEIIDALLFLMFTSGPASNGTILTIDGGMTFSKHSFQLDSV